MRFKLLINPVLVMIVLGGALTWRYKPSNTTAHQPERVDGTVKVVVKQLAVQDNVIPVEIILPVATSSAPNVLDDVTYFVKNNSGKPISAVAVTKRILYREDGKLVANTRCSTVDFLFHPDFAGSKPLASGDQAPMEAPGPTTFEDGTVIVSVTLKIDYVQYVDGSSYGAGSEGERAVLSAREGAKKYKTLLRENYVKAGKSLVTVVPLLEQDTLDKLKFTGSESEGAARYRLYLLKTFRTKGAAEIERYFKVKE